MFFQPRWVSFLNPTYKLPLFQTKEAQCAIQNGLSIDAPFFHLRNPLIAQRQGLGVQLLHVPIRQRDQLNAFFDCPLP